MSRHRLEPTEAIAVPLEAGQQVRISDPLGQQVADVVAFNLRDVGEWFSASRTIDYEGTIRITSGNVLHSNRSRPMLRIEEDTVGRHDLLFAACSREMFAIQYGVEEHPNCLEALSRALLPYDVPMDHIPTPFNVFMNVSIDDETGAVAVRPPRSTPGSHILLRAEMDVVLAVSACSAERTNAGTLGPVEVEILETPVDPV